MLNIKAETRYSAESLFFYDILLDIGYTWQNMLIGRKKEITLLQDILQSNLPEFIAIYGRRRVGKTYLISEFFKDKGIYFELTGRKIANKSAQLSNFSTVFADTFNQGKQSESPKDWDQALNILRYKINEIDDSKKIILFFDELPWLASRKSGFLEALDLFWNRYMSRKNNIIVIVCGSAAEWMIKKIVSNKSGLHNRLTKPPINLMPFSLKETEDYLASRGVLLDRKQIVDIYMALGGVAYYLNLVPRGKSSAEVISNLFFSEAAPLLTEFHRLFNSLYDNPERHLEIIETLAQTHQGMTQTKLFHQVKKLSPGGSAVAVLQELEHCGFISTIPQYGKIKKETYYRLMDPFSLFYLKWVKNIKNIPENYWTRKKASQSYNAWAGYAFENLCFQHYPQIIKALELSVVATPKSSWSSKEAQIDLIIDRADKCINLCEIKFWDDEFVIDKDYAQVLNHKKQIFKSTTQTKKSLFTTLITTYGVKKDKNYLNSVDSQLTLDALFS
ncbi:MAG: ATP-binding protein [Myxococcaceae bacterium]